jgi:hypothetical protein
LWHSASRRLEACLAALFAGLAVAAFCTGCKSGTSATVSAGYQPPFLPFAIPIDSAGNISVRGELSAETPVGTFFLESDISKNLAPVADTTQLIIEHRKGTRIVYSVFRIRGQRIDVSLDGDVQLQVTNHRVFVNATKANVQSLVISQPGGTLLANTCLVGTWHDNGGSGGSFSWHGRDVATHGGAGDIDHIFANGFDEDSFGSDARPEYGTYQGYQLELIYGGTNTASFLGTASGDELRIVEDGWRPGSSLTAIYKNHTYPVTFKKGSSYVVHFRCTASQLTWFGGGYADTETRISSRP